MAGIDRKLTIQDGFSSTLDKYAAKIEKSIQDEQRWGAALDMARYKTLAARDSLENMQAALRIFADEGATFDDIAAATDEVVRAFDKAGYSFTEAADGMDRLDLLTNNSLEKLAKSGILVDDLADAENEAAEAAERFAEAQDKATGEKAHRKVGLLTKRILGMGLALISAHKLLQYFKAAADRAPDEIAKKFTKLKEAISNAFAGTTVAAMDKMTAGIDRLNAAFKSPEGQKFLRVMEAIGRTVGTVVSWAFEALSGVIEWAGGALEKYGSQVQKVFGIIGGVLFSLKSLVSNLFNWLYNQVVSFVNASTKFLTFGFGGTNFEKRSVDFRSVADAWNDGVDYGKNKLFTDVPQQVKAIAKNTAAIADALTNEDLAAIVKAAERTFVNNVNLTSQTPIITVNGANTGNTEADRLALSRAISDILVNQLASGTISSQAGFYGSV